MSDPTLQDIEERFVYRDMVGIDGKDVTYLLQRIAQLEAELEETQQALDRVTTAFGEAQDIFNSNRARLDAVKKAATPHDLSLDEWSDGWDACCRSVLATLGGDDVN